MFGDNLDVLPPEETRHLSGMGYVGGRLRKRAADPITAIELCLDFAILEDGLSVGPDESELFESLTQSLELLRSVAQEAVAALNDGATVGQVFEILRPMARDTPPPAPSARRPYDVNYAHLFTHMAIRQLINASGAELLAWFERYAQPPSLRLRRP
jgi:hypothetical protein